MSLADDVKWGTLGTFVQSVLGSIRNQGSSLKKLAHLIAEFGLGLAEFALKLGILPIFLKLLKIGKIPLW